MSCVGLVCGVDDDVGEAGARERLDLPDDQRLAAGLEQRLGVASDSGRIRSPRPAARIIAQRAVRSCTNAWRARAVVELIEQRGERIELAIARGRAPQIAEHARHVVT